MSAAGHGRLRDGAIPVFGAGKVAIPARRDVFDRPLARYGRFDQYTKLGCAAVALALRDAGLDDARNKSTMGMVTSSTWECTSVDLAYYETTLEDGGVFASPNLFSYTLPGIMQGECAVHFQLTGPTLCVGEDGGRGYAALRTALRMMASDEIPAMIAGWLDDPPGCRQPEADRSDKESGALFVVLERCPRPSPAPVRRLRFHRGCVVHDDGREVYSMMDLFTA